MHLSSFWGALQPLLHPLTVGMTGPLYLKHGFEPVMDDPLKLFLPVPLSCG